MKKLATTLLVGSMVFGGIALANAGSDNYGKGEYRGKHCNKDHRGKGFGAGIERMAKRLDLTESQLKQVREIQAKYEPKMLAQRDKMKASHQQLREVMHADNVDQAAVKKMAQQQGDLKADKIVLHSQMRAEINKVLTKEQREKMTAMQQKREKRHHDSD